MSSEFEAEGGINDGLLYSTIGRVSAIESERPKSHVASPVDSHLSPLAQQYKPGLYGSYWNCISMSGVALPAAGNDWSPTFGDPAATLVYYQAASAGGEFVMAGDSTDARLAEVSVVCTNSFTVNGKLRMESAGSSPRVQIHCNGSIQEFTASSNFSFVLRGDQQINLIRVITNFAVGSLELRLSLWDGITCFWVNPHSNETTIGNTGGEWGGGATGTGTGANGTGAAPGGTLANYQPMIGAYQSIDDLGAAIVEATQSDIVTTTYGSASKSAIVTVTPDKQIVVASEISIAGPGLDTSAIHSGDTAGGVLAGTYPNPTMAVLVTGATKGSATKVPQVTYDSSGRITGVTEITINAGSTLFAHHTDVGNGTTVETDLYSDTIAAGQLTANDDRIEADYGGVFVSSGTATRQIKLYFGGTAVFDTGTLTLSLSAAWTLWAEIIRVSSSVVRCMVSFTTEGAALSAYTAYLEVTGLTLANTQVLKITGQAAGIGAATNDIVAKLGSVNYKPAP